MNAILAIPEREVKTIEAAPPIEWLSRHMLWGLNVHHAGTVIAVRVRLGRWQGQMVSELPSSFTTGCIDRLLKGARVPRTAEPVRILEGLLRSGEPISLEQLLLECVLVLERRLAVERVDYVPYEKVGVRSVGGEGEVELIWTTHQSLLSAASSRLVVGEFNRLLAIAQGLPPQSTQQLDTSRAELVERSRRKITPYTTSALLLAAHQRGLYADSRGGPTVQFGQGALQRVAHSTVVDGESMASARLARHKARTARTLAKLGLPAPRQFIVHSVDEAIAAAQRIGFPVVVKPLRGSGGSGVSVGVDAGAMSVAAERARDPKGSFLVEEMFHGSTFRLLVIGGRFTAALRLDQPRVSGDGRRTLRELVDALNADPDRDSMRLYPVDVDEGLAQCLSAQGHTMDSIPAPREVVIVRSAANIGSGSTYTDVTDHVHKAHAELAERATAALGLLTAGVDIVSRDIELPPYAVQSGIVEVNARPGLHTHMFPLHGTPRPVGARVLDLIVPPPADGRVPTALVLGRRGVLATADAVAAELQMREIAVGVATRQRCSIAGVRFEEDDLSLHEGIERMWRDPRVGSLVVGLDPRRAVANGVVIEAADVLCLLPRDAADVANDYVQAATLAAPSCRIIVARRGDEGLKSALDALVQRGVLAADAIQWLPQDAGRAEFADAVTSTLQPACGALGLADAAAPRP